MMKKLWTFCPRCSSGFYIDLEGDKEKIEVSCPNCDFQYKDDLEEDRVKEVKYNWELSRRLHTGMLFLGDDPGILKSASYSLILALLLFLIGIFSLLVLDPFTQLHLSIGLAGYIFSIFIIIGAINTYQRLSFAVAFSGSFFAILNSGLWGFLNYREDFLIFPREFSLVYAGMAFFLSFFSLFLILKNRTVFERGY